MDATTLELIAGLRARVEALEERVARLEPTPPAAPGALPPSGWPVMCMSVDSRPPVRTPEQAETWLRNALRRG